MQPKFIILGQDSTLADTISPIITTLRQSSANCGLPVLEANHIRSLIGYNPLATMRYLIPNTDGHVQAVVVKTYASHYLNSNNHNMKLFDSTVSCLSILKRQGHLLAVAMGKDRTGLDRVIGQTGTIHFWAATTCVSEQPSKPTPEMVFVLYDALGLAPSETLVVGDAIYDLQMAANAKVSAVTVVTGARAKAQLAAEPCLAVLDGLAELFALLATL